jgi:hypothetical protein
MFHLKEFLSSNHRHQNIRPLHFAYAQQKNQPAEINLPFIRPVADFDVWIGAFGSGRNDRVIIIRTAVITRDDPWEKIQRGRIILAGSVKPDLIRLLSKYGRHQINNMTEHIIPGGLFTSGAVFDRLRYHLGLIDYQYTSTHLAQ